MFQIELKFNFFYSPGECLWLFEQHKKGKLNQKDRAFFLKDSVEQLEIATKQYENLKKVFGRV